MLVIEEIQVLAGEPMANGISFFLTHRVRDPEDDHRGWEWYVLDSERIQQDILQILFNSSVDFREILARHDGKCLKNSQLFDLCVKSASGAHTCFEIKVEHGWSEDQRARQLEYLRQTPGARGALILFSQQAAFLTRDEIARKAGGVPFTKISYTELYEALDAIKGEQGLCELAAAYKLALRE